MNCCKSSIKPIHDEVFDLMDLNGDDTVGPEELGIVAKYILDADIQRAERYLQKLKLSNAVQHVEKLLGTTKVKKKHLSILYPKVPHEVWVDDILPELRRKEIQRLSNSV